GFDSHAAHQTDCEFRIADCESGAHPGGQLKIRESKFEIDYVPAKLRRRSARFVIERWRVQFPPRALEGTTTQLTTVVSRRSLLWRRFFRSSRRRKSAAMRRGA